MNKRTKEKNYKKGNATKANVTLVNEPKANNTNVATADEDSIDEKKSGFVLGKINYILIAAGFVLIIIGYLLLSGGKSEDPAVFNPDIFSFRRITLAPIVILLGFIVEIFAIIWKPKKK